ncbi:MAG: PadR family transcriptional regulator [Flavobacteriaceae bacterium]|jgi:PadR family transcriptional regulator PadR|nr:PadR family transcriptional regulator [Flavobacteriaceae bacterium]NBT87958.1 PadR family transcriptional regulator [Flavobacteriaceae bacterium]
MNIENTKAQMRKGVLEFCILSVLQDQEAYTSDLLQTLKSAKMLVVEGTVYPLLTRLKNSGLLQYRWEESTSGPPRKYYAITPEGQEFLNELKDTWIELQNAVDALTQSKK